MYLSMQYFSRGIKRPTHNVYSSNTLNLMTDGATYYKSQSHARGISSHADVEKLVMQEKDIFDRLLLPYLPKERSASIYEAATGPGILQCWLINRGYTCMEGSDFSENEANLAKHFNPRVVHGDSIVDLEARFKPESLSAIIALDFFEHIPRERFRDFLSIAASRLQPGGVLILRGPNADSPFVGLNLYNDITHVWAYTTTCLGALFRLAGFTQYAFNDDAIGGIHHGYWWKRLLMIPARKLLTFVCWAASRQYIRHWGMSIYVYAMK